MSRRLARYLRLGPQPREPSLQPVACWRWSAIKCQELWLLAQGDQRVLSGGGLWAPRTLQGRRL
jgi:hypothetical protein